MRTLGELEDALAEDLSWRRTELQSLRAQVRTTVGATQSCLRRAGVTLLYAHWEGYSKQGLTRYLQYVARRKLKVDELKYNFVAMAADLHARKQVHSTDIGKSIARVKWLLEHGQERIDLTRRDEVNTRSNLNSDVCDELFAMLGLDSTVFVTKHMLMDYKLLRARNEIAHGQHAVIGKDDYDELHDEVMDLLSMMRRCIIDAAENKKYLR